MIEGVCCRAVSRPLEALPVQIVKVNVLVFRPETSRYKLRPSDQWTHIFPYGSNGSVERSADDADSTGCVTDHQRRSSHIHSCTADRIQLLQSCCGSLNSLPNLTFHTYTSLKVAISRCEPEARRLQKMASGYSEVVDLTWMTLPVVAKGQTGKENKVRHFRSQAEVLKHSGVP